jgi:hypothetical protein
VVASLHAMRSAYTGKQGAKAGQPVADNDYGVVVAERLGSDNPKILNEALLASRNALESGAPHAATLAAVIKIAESHPVEGARIEAVNALFKVPKYRNNARVVAALLRVLDDKSAALLSHTLYQLYQPGAEKMAQRDAFLAKGRELLKHGNPAVRGRAARLVAVLAPNDPEARQAIRAMLDDQAPYTRSIVPHALAEMNDVAAIHLLVPKLEDQTRNNLHIRYQKLGGGNSAIPHGAKAETVHDTCAVAIEKLSAKIPEPFKRASRKHNKAGREQNLAAAKAWYAKHKGEIPALDAPPPSADAAEAKGQDEEKKPDQDEKTERAPAKDKAQPEGAAKKPTPRVVGRQAEPRGGGQ